MLQNVGQSLICQADLATETVLKDFHWAALLYRAAAQLSIKQSEE
jgi:hypothetical protein